MREPRSADPQARARRPRTGRRDRIAWHAEARRDHQAHLYERTGVSDTGSSIPRSRRFASIAAPGPLRSRDRAPPTLATFSRPLLPVLDIRDTRVLKASLHDPATLRRRDTETGSKRSHAASCIDMRGQRCQPIPNTTWCDVNCPCACPSEIATLSVVPVSLYSAIAESPRTSRTSMPPAKCRPRAPIS